VFRSISIGIRPLLGALTFVFPVASFGQEAGCVALPDTAPIHMLGRFSDMRFTEEHAYGSILELWRAGNCLFGLFQVSEGLAGDTPTGRLSDVRYTPATGQLSFTAKLSTGITTLTGSKEWVPTRDLFTFMGRMARKGVEGKLRRSDRLRSGSTPADSDITLPRITRDDGYLSDTWTYGEWRERAEGILRFRGPKW
jgi:hypothetical protein